MRTQKTTVAKATNKTAKAGATKVANKTQKAVAKATTTNTKGVKGGAKAPSKKQTATKVAPSKKQKGAATKVADKKQQTSTKVEVLRQKSCQKTMSLAGFIGGVERQCLGVITKKDNERAYAGLLTKSTREMPKHIKQNIQDILNEILANNWSSKTEGLVSTERIYIESETFNRLVNLLGKVLPKTIDTKGIKYTHIKEALKSAYTLKMRAVK